MHYLVPLPKTRVEAILLGTKHYFTGKPCLKGHNSRRRVIGDRCIECHKEYMRQYDKKNPEKKKKRDHKYMLCHKKELHNRNRDWVKKNNDRSKSIKKSYKIRHREKYLRSCRNYGAKKRLDPFYRISAKISKGIGIYLKENKEGKHWERFTPYSFPELKEHLSKLMSPDMYWENYGSYWHIDHIIPKKYFDSLPLTQEEKLHFTWSLCNLRPLKKIENLSKGSKLHLNLAQPIFKKLGLEFTIILKHLHSIRKE